MFMLCFLCVCFFSAFGFLASWLLGFLASWLLGFSASRLLGFLASWLLGFLAFWLFGFPASGLFGFLLVYAAFGAFLALAFRILCIPSSCSAGGVLAFAFTRLLAAFGGFGFSHPLLSQFLFGFFGFCTLSFVFGFGFPHHQHHQFRPI